MSQGDRDLVRYAGLAVDDVAVLLNRSRQAIYQGIASSRDYFGRPEILMICQHARRRDFKYIDALFEFIAKAYDTETNDLIQPVRTGGAQILRIIENCDEIALAVNGSEDTINPKSIFSPTINAILRARVAKLWVISAAEWVQTYLRARADQERQGAPHDDQGKQTQIEFLVRGSLENYPSFCLLSSLQNVRGFFFNRDSLDEISSDSADRLWHFFIGARTHEARKSA